MRILFLYRYFILLISQKEVRKTAAVDIWQVCLFELQVAINPASL